MGKAKKHAPGQMQSSLRQIEVEIQRQAAPAAGAMLWRTDSPSTAIPQRFALLN